LNASWPDAGDKQNRGEHLRIKQSLDFRRPSEFHNEIRNEFRWLDDLIAQCLELAPERRFADASQLLAAIETCEGGGALPVPSQTPSPRATGQASPVYPSKAPGSDSVALDELFREVRKLLANRAYDQVIDRLDIYRPAEWEVVDLRAARTLRALGQAYLGQGDFAAGRDCLEQLRAAQKEQALLSRQEHAAALSDLVKCYRGLGFTELVEACQAEARALLRS
jgi:hypothetical protein